MFLARIIWLCWLTELNNHLCKILVQILDLCSNFASFYCWLQVRIKEGCDRWVGADQWKTATNEKLSQPQMILGSGSTVPVQIKVEKEEQAV